MMSAYAIAAIVVVLAWWASTGAVLRVVWLDRSTHRICFAVASALAVAGLFGVYLSRGEATARGAYVAFASALAIWAWHELSFLLGYVTGPRKGPCPDASGLRRFVYATEAVIHHEVALAATFAGIVGLTWGAENRVATSTFAVLWVMRLSAKFNVFLGVRNLSEEFVPPHLRYLASYFRRAPFNPLLPVSVLVGGGVVAHLAQSAVSTDHAAVAVGQSMVATLLGLAVLEHLFLAFPIPDAWLWRWALPEDTTFTNPKATALPALLPQVDPGRTYARHDLDVGLTWLGSQVLRWTHPGTPGREPSPAGEGSDNGR